MENNDLIKKDTTNQGESDPNESSQAIEMSNLDNSRNNDTSVAEIQPKPDASKKSPTTKNKSFQPFDVNNVKKLGKGVSNIMDVGMDVVGLGGMFKKKFKRVKKVKSSKNEQKISKTKLHMRRSDSLAGSAVILITILAYFENEAFYKDKPDCNFSDSCPLRHNISTPGTYTMRAFIIILTIVIGTFHHLRLC